MVVHKNQLPWSSNLDIQHSQQNSANNGEISTPHDQQQQQSYYTLQPPRQNVSQQPLFVEWAHTFDMRKENLKNMPIGKLSKNVTGSTNKESALVAKSLNLVRQNLQISINRELDHIINRYVEKFFQPAIQNLRSNMGSHCVTDDHIKRVCRVILEEAKQMYLPNQNKDGTPGPQQSSNLENSASISNTSQSTNKNDLENLPEASQSVCKKKVRSSTVRVAKADNIKREAPKWDPERINKETLFVMGSRANKAMGFGPTRGRLYIKHPELFRYSGDQEDKEWLVRHSLMPPTGQKAYIMIVNDITELAQSEEYRESQNLMLHELKGFEAPESMLQKIKSFMQHMRTDLPGGHRRYRRSNVVAPSAPEPVQEIDPGINCQQDYYQPQLVPQMSSYYTENMMGPVSTHQSVNTVDTSYFSQAPGHGANGQQYPNAAQFYSMPPMTPNNVEQVHLNSYSIWNNNVGSSTNNGGSNLL